MRVSQLVEIIFVDTTGPFPESLIGNWCWIGIVDYYSHYLWGLFANNKLQLTNKMKEFFKNMTPQGTPDKYLLCDNTGEHQSKLQKVCKKEIFLLEYMTPHKPQLNGTIDRRFDIIKEGALEMLLNEKLNDTAQKILY